MLEVIGLPTLVSIADVTVLVLLGQFFCVDVEDNVEPQLTVAVVRLAHLHLHHVGPVAWIAHHIGMVAVATQQVNFRHTILYHQGYCFGHDAFVQTLDV